MSNASSNLSDSANQQAAALEQTSSAVHEISSMLSKSAELSKTAEKTSSNSKEKAEIGGHIITEMREAMKLITENTESLASQMQEGNEKFQSIINVIQEVGQKTKVINEIVFQTKLLSFNASVEAARAGEHGKGFAVVAEEVGNLAHMSGKSSGEIQELLQKSREEVQRILVQTIQKVEEGQKRTVKVAESFADIVVGVKDINLQMSQVSDATKEQEIGVKQIANAMGQLDQLAFKNTGESENSLKATEEISHASQHLNEIVDKTEIVIYGKKKKKSA